MDHSNWRPINGPDDKSSTRWTTEKWVGLSLFAIVFLFYALKAPAFAVPGRWAGILASFSGLDPFRPLIRPIWSLLVAAVSKLPFLDPGYAVNLMSAFFGAGTCWLLYAIVGQIPYVRKYRRKGQSTFERWPRMVAGVFAGMFAAVSLPMITVSTRGDYAALDSFLILLPFLPVVRYWKFPQLKYIYQSFFLLGLAVFEYPTVSFVTPLFLAWWAYLLWKTKWPSISTLVMAFAMLATGLLVVMLSAALFASTQAALIRELTAADIVKEYFRLYFAELTQGVPRVGWLLIFGMNIIPFAVVMFREIDEPTDRFTAVGVYAFRLVLFVLAVITLFSLPGSPAHVLGPKVMLLAPSIVVAIWFGYLIGYYYGLLANGGKHLSAKLFAGVWGVAVLGAGVLYAQQTSVRHLAPVAQYAETLVRELGQRNFVITDGSLDSSIALAARKVGRHVNVINLQSGQSAEYGRYYAGMFADAETRSLATLGARALLRGWLSRSTAAADQIAVLVFPDAVPAPGYSAEPHGYFYVLRPDDKAPDSARLFSRFDAIWNDMSLPDLSIMKLGDAGWFQAQFVVRWQSRQANDLGIMLDDDQRVDLSREAYRKALDIWPDNVSASLNLLEQARRLGDDEVETIQGTIRQQVERNPASLNIEYLVQMCGAVRNPGALIEEASVLGRFGRDEAALDRLLKAAEMMEGDTTAAQLSLAELYQRSRRGSESEAIYRSLLEIDASNVQAMSGLFALALRNRDFDTASSMIEQMRELGVNPQRLEFDQASLEAASGRLDDARRRLETLIRDGDGGGEAWLALAQIAIRQKDEQLIETAMSALERERNFVPGLMLLGERAMLQRKIENAQNYFARALGLDPANQPVLVRLIQIDYMNRDAASLRKHTGALLALDPDHAYANFMSAYVHIASANYALAEAVLRRSLNQVDNGAARNELAWVLSQLGKNEEALTHAKRAVELEPKRPNYLDTLAGIYSKLGQHDAAIAAIEHALELTERNAPSISLHAAKIYQSAGQDAKAVDILQHLSGQTEVLNDEQMKEYGEIRTNLHM